MPKKSFYVDSHTPKHSDRLDQTIAEMLHEHNCPSLYLEWAAERFWGIALIKILPVIDKIHDNLANCRIVENNPLHFNKGDDSVFFIPCRDFKVFAHIT